MSGQKPCWPGLDVSDLVHASIWLLSCALHDLYLRPIHSLFGFIFSAVPSVYHSATPIYSGHPYNKLVPHFIRVLLPGLRNPWLISLRCCAFPLSYAFLLPVTFS